MPKAKIIELVIAALITFCAGITSFFVGQKQNSENKTEIRFDKLDAKIDKVEDNKDSNSGDAQN